MNGVILVGTRSKYTPGEAQFIKNVGFRVQYFRRKADLSQEQLAEKMNVSTPYIAKIETGKQTGPVELAVEFAAFCLCG